jgi:TadE-like protein
MLARSRQGHRSRGQSLVEFAIVAPIVIAIIGAIVQFGIVFWAQNTLTQVVRDTGRWEATQQATPCLSGASALVGQADTIAGNSSLFGYVSGEFTNNWTSANVLSTDASINAFTTPNSMAVAWVDVPIPPAIVPPSSDVCPPPNNSQVWHVTIKMNQTVPIFFPGMQFLPQLGTCDSSGCRITLSSTAQFRMEPTP